MLVAVFAPWLAPYRPSRAAGPAVHHPDAHPGSRRDPGVPARAWTASAATCCSKLIWGARASLLIGVVSTAIGLIGGMILGLLAGTFGGWVDTLIMRFVDILLSVPSLLLAVSIAAILGQTPARDR